MSIYGFDIEVTFWEHRAVAPMSFLDRLTVTTTDTFTVTQKLAHNRPP